MHKTKTYSLYIYKDILHIWVQVTFFGNKTGQPRTSQDILITGSYYNPESYLLSHQ